MKTGKLKVDRQVTKPRERFVYVNGIKNLGTSSYALKTAKRQSVLLMIWNGRLKMIKSDIISLSVIQL